MVPAVVTALGSTLMSIAGSWAAKLMGRRFIEWAIKWCARRYVQSTKTTADDEWYERIVKEIEGGK